MNLAGYDVTARQLSLAAQLVIVVRRKFKDASTESEGNFLLNSQLV